MTIINMPYSDKGRDNHDRVFGRVAQEQKIPVKVLPGGMKCEIIDIEKAAKKLDDELAMADKQHKIEEETKDTLVSIECAITYWLENYIILYGYDASKGLLSKMSAMVEEANTPPPKGIMQAKTERGNK